MWQQTKALIIKETLAVWRDKAVRFVLFIPPLIQLFVMSYAVTLEVKNISIAIFNQDNGWYSNEIIQRIKGSPSFKYISEYDHIETMTKALTNGEVIVALQFPSDFSAQIEKGDTATVQMILDGRRANSAQIVEGYLTEIIQNNAKSQHIMAISRAWFNPNLDYIFYTVPGLIGILSMVMALAVASLSVAREKEMGTFDQLLISPLTSWQILIGKAVPPLLFGLFEATIMLIIARLFFKVPFEGSLLLFYVSLVIFLASVIGVGLFISSLVRTQQQALLGACVFMVPTIALSGYATPIENMPTWLQPISSLLPNTYFFRIIKGIFLKDMAVIQVWDNIWPMILIALFTSMVAVWMFKKRVLA